MIIAYTIKSRLVKKINQFANQELPLLIEKGYLTEFCKLTDNCKFQQGIGSSLVKIRCRHVLMREKKKTHAPGRIRTNDPPAMSRQNNEDNQIIDLKQQTKNKVGGRGQGFESLPYAVDVIINWQQFHQFLLQRMATKTAEDRLRYAKQFADILQLGNAQSPPNNAG